LQLQQKKIEKEREVYTKQADVLKELTIEFTANAGITGHLYGTITTEMVAAQIKEKTNLEISKKKIVLNTHIKSEGQYHAKIKLFSGVDVSVPVIVKVEKSEEDLIAEKNKKKK